MDLSGSLASHTLIWNLNPNPETLNIYSEEYWIINILAPGPKMVIFEKKVLQAFNGKSCKEFTASFLHTSYIQFNATSTLHMI